MLKRGRYNILPLFSYMEFLNIVASIQILFFFFLLYRKENLLNRLLAVIILLPGLNFFSNAINLLGGSQSPTLYGALFFIVQSTSLIFAPVVFYYISLLCGKKVKITYWLFVLTGAIILYNYYQAIEFFLSPLSEKITFIDGLKNEQFPTGQLILNLLFILMQQVYFTIAAVRVYKFKNKIKDVFSTRSTLKVGFVQSFITLVWILNVISLVLYATIPMYLVEYIVLPSVIICINFFIIYFAFEYQVIFNKDTYTIFLKDLKLLDIDKDIDEEIKPESIKNELNASDILEFLTTQKTYLNSDYTIYELANQLKEHPRNISKIINSELNKNFLQLINEFRIEESIRLLRNDKVKFTIEAICLQAGFKSRSSFYRVFKIVKGTSPLEFITKEKR